MLGLGDVIGLWRRSLIRWPDGRCDTATRVLWLQGKRAFGDIRQPPAQEFAHARALGDLSRHDCARLAEQQGFAGHLTFDGRFFEWVRMIDFQPRGAHADAGSLRWEGEVLIEQGRDVPYIEHWHRDPLAAVSPCAALQLRDTRRHVDALLIRVGRYYIFARDRALKLPAYTTLGECIAQATSLEEAHALIDCEISMAQDSGEGPRVTVSTLPYRVGERLLDGLGPRGGPASDWEIVRREGESERLERLL
jgi:hypothetical protein